MDTKIIIQLLKEHLITLDASETVLKDSYERVSKILKKSSKKELRIEEKESCEALTARFARLCDFLFQRVFRTIDRIELQDEGTAIDRLNRMEKRGIISSASLWRDLRELRNEIAHEYLIEKSDRVLIDAHKNSPELFSAVRAVKEYIKKKRY